MLVYGVLKESGFWYDGIFGKKFKIEDSWTVLCNSEEEARNEAEKMWRGLAPSDKKTTKITASKRILSNEEIEEIMENYGADTEGEIAEIAVSENYDVILEIYRSDDITIIKDENFYLYDASFCITDLKAKNLKDAEKEADEIIKKNYDEDFYMIVKNGIQLAARKRWLEEDGDKPYEDEKGCIFFDSGFYSDWEEDTIEL